MSETALAYPHPSALGRLRTASLVYSTNHGAQYVGDSAELMKLLPDSSVDLILTSPPFALLRQKSYGNESQELYVAWLSTFGREALRVMRPAGSFVLDLGGSYRRGVPVRSLYNYRVLIEFCDILGFKLAEEFFWYNSSKLPSPIEWVNKRKIRVKDAVNTIWWLSKSDFPKADVRRVLGKYSARMQTLLRDPEAFYKPGIRPSEHQVSTAFARDNGGSIPSNLLQFANSESTSKYLKRCRLLREQAHPARFPADLPRFFIRFLTEPTDVVLDIFAGSNTTGFTAEQEGRRWLSFDLDERYAQLSAVRFMDSMTDEEVARVWSALRRGDALHLNGSSISSYWRVSDGPP